MSRITTSGGEIGRTTNDRRTGPDGDRELSTGTVTQDSANARLGLGMATKCDTAAGNVEAFREWTPAMTPTLDRNYFLRAYFKWPTITPASEYNILAASLSGSTVCAIRHKTNNTLVLSRRVNTPANLGSDGPVMVAGQYYRVEMRWKVATVAANGELEFYLDGVLIATATSQNLNATALNRFEVGTSTSPGASWVMYDDDVALNDDQGTSENSYPGDRKIVLCVPTAIAQAGSWLGGAGGAATVASIATVPPTGTATETNNTQIESVDTTGDNATDELRATLTTYLAAGIIGTGRIRVIHAGCWHGEDVLAGTKTGSVGMFSNPAGSLKAFTYGADLGALGTWDANWEWTYADPIYDPTPDLATAPAMNVRKTDVGSATASICFIGAYVEFEPFIPRATAVNFVDPGVV